MKEIPTYKSLSQAQMLEYKIYETIKDFKREEVNDLITPQRVNKWVNQFSTQDREIVRSETLRILKKRYYSRKKVQESFILGLLKFVKKKYRNNDDFINSTVFLDLQPKGKSQGIYLEMVNSLSKKKFNCSINRSPHKNVKHYIYIDDVLCTGNTFYQDIESWASDKAPSGKTYLSELLSNKFSLINAFVFIHDKNFLKKQHQFSYRLADNFNTHLEWGRNTMINNSLANPSKLDCMIPVENGQSDIVHKYKIEVENSVDEYVRGQYQTKPEFFRPNDLPKKENFFSSAENRMKYENILLKKGIEILRNSSIYKPNIRPLGYSLPSVLDFGFGALCFTFNNVPNNSPLVFWYSGEGFMPLFPRKAAGKYIPELDPNFGADAVDLDTRFEKKSDLFAGISIWRQKKSKELKKPRFEILLDKTINSLADLQPKNLNDLKKIIEKDRKVKNIAKAKIEAYGKELLEIISPEEFEKSKSVTEKSESALNKIDQVLFDEISNWRLKKSKEKEWPAFCILNNQTIKDIVYIKPRNIDDLQKVKGIGKAKTEAYGKEILDIISFFMKLYQG